MQVWSHPQSEDRGIFEQMTGLFLLCFLKNKSVLGRPVLPTEAGDPR